MCTCFSHYCINFLLLYHQLDSTKWIYTVIYIVCFTLSKDPIQLINSGPHLGFVVVLLSHFRKLLGLYLNLLSGLGVEFLNIFATLNSVFNIKQKCRHVSTISCIY
jgi:hypothetical protein